MASVQERLEQMLEPVIASLGYELLLLEYSPSPKNAMLRLYIDAAAGITLDDCERVSKEVAGVLDVEDPIRSAYRLEVSSPGLDRPLVKPAHFQRFIGQQARVQLMAPLNGRRRFIGAIVGADEDVVRIETEEGVAEIPLAEIDRARLVPDYDQE
ncbi:ribosome maturation factor RimP [Solimonas terrae]|uniref:Ribosome maturation factor RimP n=1 Tax=Solimonas terrae TaxID=1396819 RepID=A0A6M2BVI6_9GAMM|nr:ribosome maturation factor RimP [Solimonas terrae]NGY06143.1 ribosome maturation factor RimP [Solimonas terrae]